MKTLTSLTLFLVLISTQAHAGYVCHGKNEPCSSRRNLICAEVEKLNDSTYRLSRLQHISGCLAWGVSKFKSKRKICKKMLKAFGETKKVSYLPGSEVRGEWETALGIESIGQIDCEIKE